MPKLWPMFVAYLLLLGVFSDATYVVHTHHEASNFYGLKLTSADAKTLASEPSCQALLVESMPANLTYFPGSPKFASTQFAWELMLEMARTNLTIASFYWSLLAEPQFNASHSEPGRDIYSLLKAKAHQLKLSVEQSGAQTPVAELDELVAAGAHLYWVDVTGMLGTGVLHTKLWTADGKYGYVGSANMDWRSLTQVKELGVLLINCPELVDDLDRIHGAYQLVSNGLPAEWPRHLVTRYNETRPVSLQVNGIPSRVYFSSSPLEFNPPGRTNDLDALLNVIAKSQQFIYISVMNYSPEIINYSNNASGQYWPVIDAALRTAALDRGVEVRLLISRWSHSSKSLPKYLESLRCLNGVNGARLRVRYFVVPSFTEDQHRIPFARVNHNKYMVTDTTAYIGTSNWSGDYFLKTGGVAFVYEEDLPHVFAYPNYTQPQSETKTLRTQLVDVFLRDWNSEYATEQWD